MTQRGRPTVLDDKMRDLVCGLVGMGFSRWQAARHLGIGKTTLFRAAKEDQAFAKRLREAELQQEINPLRRIVEHSHKSWRAAAWILERQKPDLYVRRAPDTVTLADLHGIFNAMMKLLLSGVPQQADRDRVMQNFDLFFEELGGRKRSSPRVRRAIKKLQQDGNNGTQSVPESVIGAEESSVNHAPQAKNAPQEPNTGD
jgi:hypothetical protein